MVINGRRIWHESRSRTDETQAGRVSESTHHPGRLRCHHQEPGKLLFVNQYYWPDHASTAQHLADLAEHLATRGHDVHVLCGQGAYKPGTPKLPGRRESTTA